MNTTSFRFRHNLSFIFCALCAWVSVLIIVLVVVILAWKGAGIINWRFLTASWQHRDITQGGIFPAIVGSLWLGIGVLLLSFPTGLATAVFLTEYGAKTRWRRVTQLAIRNLAGVPSVVYGLFGLAVFAQGLGLGMSLITAILTLGIMTLPWIITAGVEALEAVPARFRENSLALGATHLQTTWNVVLPSALPGAITGGVIGLARAMGETAPLILVGATFYLSQLPHSPLDPFMALPYHAFILATQHSSPQAPAYAAGTSLVLIALTSVITLGAIIARYRLRTKRDW